MRTYGLWPRGGRVIVALSGGPDSTALLHVLAELRSAGDVEIAGIAHLNHGLRAAADEDERFCRTLAADVGAPIHVERIDVRELAGRWRTSIEDAGRRARYAWFEQVGDELGAAAIATGHTRDDQAETFLLQLIRGAGPRGLAGIAPRRGRVCRPLIEVRRDELRSYLEANGLAFQEDESNRDLAFTRNRVRHQLLPGLERDFSPGIVDVLAREARIARQDEDRLQAEAIEVADAVVLPDRDGAEIDVAALRALHPAVASRVVRMALGRLASKRYLGFDHVERVLSLAAEAGRGSVSLPGQEARRIGERIVLRRRFPAPFANSFRFPLSIPGEVLLESQNWAVSAAMVPHPEGAENNRSLIVAVSPAGVALPLSVRSRQPGDRLMPKGMKGQRKKLQDLFVDCKIARPERDRVPLVVDRDDRILWVVGAAVAEDFGVTAASQGVLLLKARRLGGLG
ncbi:MAG: tRNA lysidine(34) synthetase TilS [Vicinamibacterales bacterium]